MTSRLVSVLSETAALPADRVADVAEAVGIQSDHRPGRR